MDFFVANLLINVEMVFTLMIKISRYSVEQNFKMKTLSPTKMKFYNRDEKQISSWEIVYSY